ncbi:MAG: 4-(cytidine 5'-diphospho)-2-C-methyl-D-erythritol kinase [Oscillospiraceae bacterium]
MNRSISVKSYAKLNLYLEITGKRDDGYHLLRSVMQSISLCDCLKFDFSEGSGIEIICNTAGIPLGEKNLVWKAINAFYNASGLSENKVTVLIEKNIPSMAGMAGGSSDAAAALTVMNEFYGKIFTQEQLCSIGAKLGADIPFCLKGGTVLCEGVGDIMTKIPSVPDCCFVVVKPDVSVSTPEAYKRFDNMETAESPDYDGFMSGLKNSDIISVSDNIYNSLEIACNLEEVNEIKDKLIEHGALNAMMTGSGSAVFGIFKDKITAENAVEHFSDYSFSGVFMPFDKGVEIVDL